MGQVTVSFFVAKALQAKLCLHEISFAGRKNSENFERMRG